MGMKKYSVMILVSLILQLVLVLTTNTNTNNPYSKSCPKAVFTIKSGVYRAVLKDRRIGASLLRLHFHDCFVNGCDASVLLDDTPSFRGEKTAAPNSKSLRGFEVVDSIKSDLESVCPGVVSCADLLAVAARDSVVAMGGPFWEVELGRKDSTTASLDDANTQIPSPSLDLPDLISAFSNKGFSAKQLVALSGSHTIGEARCTVFRSRIHNETNSLATSLKTNCPINGTDDDDALSPLDSTSPVFFDNAYFKNLINNKGLLHSDQQLFSGAATDSDVTAYANNPAAFFSDFADAMIKMGSLTGSGSGEIRTNCRMIN